MAIPVLTARHYVSKTKTFAHDGQDARIRINGQIDCYVFDKIPHTFLTVNLDGSTVSASDTSKIANDRDDKRGWYTEWAEVMISLNNEDFVARQDSPQTTMGSVATTSTTSLGIDVGMSAMGSMPSPSVGAGLSIGSSVTRNLSDFKVKNTTNERVVRHVYKMSSSTGGAYETPSDLVDMSPGGQLQGSPLFDPPDLAVDNTPILSTVIFMSQTPQREDVDLTISVKHHLAQVEKTFKFFSISVDTESVEWTFAVMQKIPLSMLEVEA